MSETLGREAALDDRVREAPVFYGTFAVVVVVAVAIVLIPGAPLVPILFLSQALNAVLLLPLLVFVRGIARDRDVMGEHALGRADAAITLLVIVLLAVCVAALAVLTIF